jgi:hypothetical protein
MFRRGGSFFGCSAGQKPADPEWHLLITAGPDLRIQPNGFGWCRISARSICPAMSIAIASSTLRILAWPKTGWSIAGGADSPVLRVAVESAGWPPWRTVSFRHRTRPDHRSATRLSRRAQSVIAHSRIVRRLRLFRLTTGTEDLQFSSTGLGDAQRSGAGATQFND